MEAGILEAYDIRGIPETIAEQVKETRPRNS